MHDSLFLICFVSNFLPIFLAYETLTIVEGSVESIAIVGKIYSGKILASLRGISFTILRQAVNVEIA